ncbi:MAG: Dam family site-specific DNA-(adenine-N6)-methyltransferase [Bacteroidetes bacterium]|nr:Dam family site-specific DNA-(adenine-N6)-methyltransferase [Bacteroidota bacterium]
MDIENKTKLIIPPIKCQGIKTKLVSWIKDNLSTLKFDRWLEPFMGSGVVGFNVRPHYAIFADTNIHLINFYNAIKNGEITPSIARSFLESESIKLAKSGQKYYNEVRERFNSNFKSLDFLFLNRSCFNGMIRFNRYGKFNVPFGHKPNRFSKAYITKIVNQIDYISQAVKLLDWQFVCQDFRETLKKLSKNDFIYCDPPYLGRHVDYFDSWNDEDEKDLFNILNKSNSKYILSTWHSNQFRSNKEIEKYNKQNIQTKEHFYHVGASEKNRNAMTEALILNYLLPKQKIDYTIRSGVQLQIMEPKSSYKARK